MQKNSFLKLQKGDTIAIVSPSGFILPEYIDGAVRVLNKCGFHVLVGKYAKNIHGRYAGDVQQRVEDFQWAINNPNIKAILCARGGYGAIQIIDKIDFSILKKHPKWLIGFSDITVFHSALSNLKIPSIHASMAKHLTEALPTDDTVVFLQHILEGKYPTYQTNIHPLNKLGKTTGTLVGGNLSVLYGLRGTPFDIKPKGKILFIEDLNEKPYHIDRMMNNLKIGGILKNISGLVVGQFSEIQEDESMLKSISEIISDAVQEYNYPVCFNFPSGHVSQNMPLIFGTKVDLNVSNQNVSLNFNIAE